MTPEVTALRNVPASASAPVVLPTRRPDAAAAQGPTTPPDAPATTVIAGATAAPAGPSTSSTLGSAALTAARASFTAYAPTPAAPSPPASPNQPRAGSTPASVDSSTVTSPPVSTAASAFAAPVAAPLPAFDPGPAALAPVPSPVPVDALPEEIARAARLAVDPRGSEAIVHLDPPDLGRVRIEIKVHGKDVTVHITAERDDVQSLLEEGRNALGDRLRHAARGVLRAKGVFATAPPGRASRGAARSILVSGAGLSRCESREDGRPGDSLGPLGLAAR
jgi:flagellar hook-length control protein FliK